MNIYFILFGFIILYMFKIVCNRIEGMVEQENCPGNCVSQSSIDFVSDHYQALLDDLTKKKNKITHERNEYKDQLEQCQKSGPPSPSCPSCPPSPSHTPSKRVFCDPNADPPQLCPDQSKCPQCGNVKCPCPE